MKDAKTLVAQIPIESVAEFFSLGHIISTLLVLAFVWLLLKMIAILSQALSKRFSRYRMQIAGILPIMRIIIWVTTIYVIVIGIFAPPQNSLIALLASTGLAVGLAAQEIIRNLISGVIILFEKPFRVGDMVRIGNSYGEVQTIGLRSIRLHTFDDNVVTVPNSVITGQAVSNSNNGALDEQVVVSFNVPASLDVELVRNLAWEAAASSPYVYLKKPIVVLAEDLFNRTFLTRFHIKAYVLEVRYERLFASDIIERVKKALRDRDMLTDELVRGALLANDTQ